MLFRYLYRVGHISGQNKKWWWGGGGLGLLQPGAEENRGDWSLGVLSAWWSRPSKTQQCGQDHSRPGMSLEMPPVVTLAPGEMLCPFNT